MTQRALRSPLLWLPLPWLFAAQLSAAAPTLRYEVIARYKHPDNAFTQGLELSGDTLYESSGLYWRSYISSCPLTTGASCTKQSLPYSVFGEGLTLWNDRIYTLSWREKRGFIFDKKTLKKLGEFSYQGEGWGLTHNDAALIMSDGTSMLRFINPNTLVTERSINISDGETPIDNLNELEWIPAHSSQPERLLANIWQSDEIVVIDSEKGRVTARLDLSKLYPKSTRSEKADVLNGIALDTRDQSLLITGKFWPYIYRIRVLDALP
ncbi:MAG: glutaminyl-peptide cyclotransferase [Spongiibacteraceae bacterium]